MTAQDFIFKSSPYKKIVGQDYEELFKDLSDEELSVNVYNPLRHAETTYHLSSAPIIQSPGPYQNFGFEPVDEHVRVMSFNCGRFNDTLTLLIYFNRKDEFIIKIGSYPSLKDFHKDDIKKYEKILNDTQRNELLTAINIYNNGVGIGSYVYLRRIFESIVFEEGENSIKEGKLSEEDFKKMHMDERIVALKDRLPSFLYEHHTELYGILSKGVHELDEGECLDYYPVLYDCISLILDERLAQREKKLTTKNAASALSKIAKQIRE